MTNETRQTFQDNVFFNFGAACPKPASTSGAQRFLAVVGVIAILLSAMAIGFFICWHLGIVSIDDPICCAQVIDLELDFEFGD